MRRSRADRRAAAKLQGPPAPPTPPRADWAEFLAADPLRRVMGGTFAFALPSRCSLLSLRSAHTPHAQPADVAMPCARRALRAVDFGRVKTGVAVSAGGLAPRPVAVLRVPGHTPELIDALLALAQKEDAQARREAAPARACERC